MMNLPSRLWAEDTRTQKANKNVIVSLFVKGIDCIVQLILVPLTLGYLNAYEYGIWLTLNSILIWINTFDIGLGNGLRNKLATAVSNNDHVLAKSLVSTAFGMIAVITALLIIFGSVIVCSVDWYKLLGADTILVPNLNQIVYYSFLLFCMNFMFRFVGNIYMGMQMPSVSNLLITLGHLFSLFLIFILSRTTDGSLLYVAVAFSASPVFIYCLAYPITFKVVYKQLKPSLKFFEKRLLPGLFGLGVLFFFLNIAGLVLFALSNVLISKLFGPEQVTPYNIAYRYFSLIYVLLIIMLAPTWTAATDAQASGDYKWLVESLQRTEKMLVIFGVGVLLMFAISDFVYKLWLGSDVVIPVKLSGLVALYVYIVTCSTAYSYYLNGLGKLIIQLINTVSVSILFIPLCLLLGDRMGLNGVIICLIIVNLTGLLLNCLQVHKLISNKASGLWNK